MAGRRQHEPAVERRRQIVRLFDVGDHVGAVERREQRSEGGRPARAVEQRGAHAPIDRPDGTIRRGQQVVDARRFQGAR